MSWDDAWPQPSTEALDLIERVYRLSNTLRVMEIDPGRAGVAMLISLKEAFSLLDHMQGPWRMAVWSAARPGLALDVETVQLDLAAPPRPGSVWVAMFGVSLIVRDGMPGDTPPN